MMEEEQQILKDALGLVNAAGGSGVLQSKLLGALTRLDGQPLDAEQKAVIWGMLTGRNWITWHMEPVFHCKRWTITESGARTLECLN